MSVSDSKFNMWRAVFALAHADHVVTEEERRFMYKVLATENFSGAQKNILEEDMEIARDIPDMFMSITDPKDRSRFFYFARMLFWCDGDFAAQEQKILTELQRAQCGMADLSADTGLRLENDEKEWLLEDMKAAPRREPRLWDMFIERFRD